MKDIYTDKQRTRHKTQLAERAARKDPEGKLKKYDLVYTYGVKGSEELNFGKMFKNPAATPQYEAFCQVFGGGLCIFSRPSDNIYVMGAIGDAPWLMDATAPVMYLDASCDSDMEVYIMTLKDFLEYECE